MELGSVDGPSSGPPMAEAADLVPVVSVVIPVLNGASVIHIQLQALVEQADAPPFEVVVADNGSTDDLVGAVEMFASRLGIRVVDAGRVPGISHARNVGARAASADKILFCDDDDAVNATFVRDLADALVDHDLVGGIADVTANSRRVREWTDPPPRDALPVTMKFLPYAVGCCMGIRRDALVRVAGFDEAFRCGHEEVDLAWRVQLSGGSVAIVPTASVQYRQRDTVRALIRQRFRYGRSYAQLYAKHRSQPIPRTPLRLEVRKILHLVRRGPSQLGDPGTRGKWLGTMAFVAGRLRGDLEHRVRAPQ